MQQAIVLDSLLPLAENINDGLYLALVGTHRLPPHVALIHQGLYFAQTVNGPQIGRQAADVIQVLQNRQIPFLLLELKSPSTSSAPNNFFIELKPLEKGHSCIEPIVDYLKHTVSLQVKKPYLHGLLQALIQAELLSATYALPMPEKAQFTLEPYGKERIDWRISNLQKRSNP